MAETSKTVQKKISFSVGEDDIRSLWRLLADHAEEPAVYINCSDDSDISFDTIDALFNFPNSQNRAIKTLRLATNPWPKEKCSIKISFNDDPYIHYQIKGADQNVIAISSAIEEILSNTKQWYSKIVYPGELIEGFVIALLILIGLLFFQAGLVGIEKISEAHNSSEKTFYEHVTTICSLSTFCLIVIVLKIGWLRNFLFPAGSFTIGAGRARFQKSKDWRTFIGVPCIVAVIAGVVSIYVYSHFFGP